MSNAATWLGAVDPARREAFERALNVAGAGSTLLQTFINRTVQQIHLRELGAAAVLPRRPGQGNAAYINRRAPGSAADWVADTDAVTEATGTYTQVSFPYKTLATRGKVTRKLQATGRRLESKHPFQPQNLHKSMPADPHPCGLDSTNPPPNPLGRPLSFSHRGKEMVPATILARQ